MMSLFRRFDLYFFPLKIIRGISITILFLNTYVLNLKHIIFNWFLNVFEIFFRVLKFKSINTLALVIFESIILTIFVANFISVFTFNFPLTSQIRVVIIISLGFWVSFMLFYTFTNLKGFVSHCIPEGSPLYLIVFLFLIEIVRNLIRPITLIVRLAANILSGHLLIILLSKLVFLYTSIFPLYLGLNIIELFVAIIQAYIFITIICLYYAEVN